ncbi:hypothetical protein JOS77_30375 [Chromobacterium haemolyticum]|nr:hypothetical protein JOS77_30375 [Chromobacterium haemolyticum]
MPLEKPVQAGRILQLGGFTLKTGHNGQAAGPARKRGPQHNAGSGHNIHSESLALDGQGRPAAPVFGSVIGATRTMRELQIKLDPELNPARCKARPRRP